MGLLGNLSIETAESSVQLSVGGEIQHVMRSLLSHSTHTSEFRVIATGLDGIQYKVHYDIVPDYSHLKAFRLNKVWNLWIFYEHHSIEDGFDLNWFSMLGVDNRFCLFALSSPLLSYASCTECLLDLC